MKTTIVAALLLAVVLGACRDDFVDGDTDGDVDDTRDPHADDDGDGWLVGQGDCDDTDPTVNPGEDEQCDTIDHDCDGVVSVPLVDSCDFVGPGGAIYPGTTICQGGTWLPCECADSGCEE